MDQEEERFRREKWETFVGNCANQGVLIIIGESVKKKKWFEGRG